jgi:hypothetical protein
MDNALEIFQNSDVQEEITLKFNSVYKLQYSEPFY